MKKNYQLLFNKYLLLNVIILTMWLPTLGRASGFEGELNKASSFVSSKYNTLDKNNIDVKSQDDLSLQFSEAELNFTGKVGSVIQGQSVTVSASSGSPRFSISDDPASSDWLVLPKSTDADGAFALGDLLFTIKSGLTVGHYDTVVFAIDESGLGYSSAQITINLDITPADITQPSFTNVTPNDSETNVAISDFQINVEVLLPEGYELNSETLNGNVNLYEIDDDGDEVFITSNSNDTGGGDAITTTPSSELKEFTRYIYRIDGVEANKIGAVDERIPFSFFESSFTTGEKSVEVIPIRDLSGVEFTKVLGGDALGEGTIDERFSSLTIGPDGKLYGSTLGDFESDGKIYRWDINLDGTLANLEILSPELTGSPHPDDPNKSDRGNNNRLIIGLVFDPSSTADNLVAYVTHSMAALTKAPEWDGKLTRLSGPNLSTVEDVLIHLPRSIRDHMTNSMTFDSAGAMYIVQGSNSAGGAPDATWGNRPESLLSGAVLKLDLDKLPAKLPLSVHTSSDIAVINNASSSSLTMSDGTYNPYADQAPLTIFATGVRNAYDLVWHSNGWLYMPTNGTAGNEKTSPNSPAYTLGSPLARRIDGRTSIGAVPQMLGGETQKDWLFKTRGGSYHGHPNPYRGEFILNHGGKAYSGIPGQANTNYRDVIKYPSDLGPDVNYMEPAYDFGKNKSPNGVIEYKSDAFEGKLQGLLMVVRFSGQDDVMVLDPKSDGDIAEVYTNIPGLKKDAQTPFDDPLEIIEDPKTGNLYVSEYDQNDSSHARLTLLRAMIPASGASKIVASNKELLFETTVNDNGSQQDSRQLKVSNEGNKVVNISNVAIEGAFADQFKFEEPLNKMAIYPGESITYTVTYQPLIDTTNLGYQDAKMLIQSDDKINPELKIGLYSLKKQGYSNSNEPALQDVLSTLGVKVNVGWASLISPSQDALLGDEIAVDRWIKSGSLPVKITALGRYSNSEAASFGWYTSDETFATHEKGVFAEGVRNSQILNPIVSSENSTVDTLDSKFGIYVKLNESESFIYSEDYLNTSDFQHKARIYSMKDRSGNIVPNTYILAFEVNDAVDYQDYIFKLENVNAVEADNVPPTITAKFEGATNDSAVYTSSVEVTLQASDPTNRASVTSLTYILDENKETAYTESFRVSENGNHTLHVKAIDENGGVSEEDYNFTIDSEPLLYVENMNKIPTTNRGFPADNYYSFNRLKNTTANEGLPTHDSNVMRLNNTGTGDLIISEINVSDTTKFTYEIITDDNVPVTLPLVIAPGAYKDLNIKFIGEIIDGAGNAKTLYKEAITVISNSEDEIQNTSVLHGAFASKTEGNNEISAQEIIDVLGFKTSMLSLVNEEGTINPRNKNKTRPSSNYPTADNTDAGYEGDMIISPTFVQADPLKPVTGIQVMALHGPETGLCKFVELNSGDVVGGISFRHDKTQYQTLFPLGTKGSTVMNYGVAESITEPFRISVNNLYATGGGSDLYGSNPDLLGVRVYKVINQDGFIVPNEYIVIQDFIGEGCTVPGEGNCDFNDNVFYFTNIRPEAVPQAGEIEPYAAHVNTAFTYDISVFINKAYPGNKLNFSASLEDGAVLPQWLSINHKTGVISGTPPEQADSTYSILVSAVDLNGLKTSSSFELNILKGLIAIDDSFTLKEDSLDYKLDVLANDNLGSEDFKTLSVIKEPSHGTVSVADNGTPSDPTDDNLIYNPNANFFGSDSVTYEIEDVLGQTAQALVSITVTTDTSDTPTAVDDAFTVDEDSENNDFKILDNDDFGGDGPGTLTLVVAPLNGIASVNNNGTPNNAIDDKISYTPNANYYGEDSLSYSIIDPDGSSSQAIVNITINPDPSDLPTANDDIYSVVEDSNENIFTILTNDDFGWDGAGMIQILTSPIHGLAYVVDNGTPADPTDDTIGYVPDENYNGVDSLKYVISDSDGQTAEAVVNITVSPDDSDMPSGTNDAYSVMEDSGINSLDVLSNDNFGGDGAGRLVIVTMPINGIAVVDDSGTPDDASDDKIFYTPNSDFFGNDTFVYTISDKDGQNVSATVNITVTPDTSDEPFAFDDTFTVMEDSQENIFKILDNDDFGGDGPGAIVISVMPNNGSASVWDNNTPFDLTDDSVLYTPEDNFYGEDSLQYEISDNDGQLSSATVTITINPDSTDEPTANNDSYTVAESSENNTFNILSNDNFGGDGAGNITITKMPTYGAAVINDNGSPDNVLDDYIVYTPNSKFSGSDEIQYAISDIDGQSSSAIISILIAEDVPPVAIVSSSANGGEAPFAVQFYGDESYDDRAISSYIWDFKDGERSKDINPNHTFQTQGTYDVSLLVTDTKGLTDEGIVTITIKESTLSTGNNDSYKIAIYPNPASSKVNVEISNPLTILDRITIHDLKGTLTHDYDPASIKNGAIYTLPTYELEAGIYIISIIDNNGSVNRQKLIIKR
ncbi:MAG: Ig-like domain-containing protein [Leeuwenhoekiella sp.]